MGRGKVGGDGFAIASFEFESFFSESEFFSFTMMDLPLSPAITSMKATGQPVDGTTHPASVEVLVIERADSEEKTKKKHADPWMERRVGC